MADDWGAASDNESPDKSAALAQALKTLPLSREAPQSVLAQVLGISHSRFHRPDTMAGDEVLHLQHMDTIGVRELQQHASAALRRVERGESIGVTDRGRLVAVLVPPSSANGMMALIAAGRVQSARSSVAALPQPAAATRRSGDVLDELRSEE